MARQFLTGVDLKNQKAINVASPTAATDAVNKAYVDNVAAGLSAHPSVRAATTANITLSGTQTVDGVALVAGDRVLVKNQTTASTNGIYVVASGAWTTALDGTQGELTSGAFLTVTEGTVNDNTLWVLATNNPITVGTTSLTWSPLAAGTVYSAGNGISISSNVIAAVIADSTLTLTSSGLAVNPAGTLFAKKQAFTLAAGSTSTAVTHTLNTTDVVVSVYDITSTPVEVEMDVTITSATVVTFTTATAVTANQYRAVIVG